MEGRSGVTRGFSCPGLSKSSLAGEDRMLRLSQCLGQAGHRRPIPLLRPHSGCGQGSAGWVLLRNQATPHVRMSQFAPSPLWACPLAAGWLEVTFTQC